MGENDYQDWRDLIGGFMMIFANIECDIARALIDYSELSYEDFKEMSFSKRVGRLKNNVHKMGLPDDERKYLMSSLDRTLELAKIRNLIAHNPLDLSFESIFDGPSKWEIRSVKDPSQVVDKSALEKLVNELSIQQESIYESLSYAGYLDA